MTKESDILDYAKGKQRGKKANRLERESLNDPFLSDALEGFEQSGEHEQAVNELRSLVQLEVAKAAKPRKRDYRLINYLLAAAAVILLFLILTPFVYEEVKHYQYLALLDDVQEAPPVNEIVPVTEKTTPVYAQKMPGANVVSDIVAQEDRLLLADASVQKRGESSSKNLNNSELESVREIASLADKETLTVASVSRNVLAEAKLSATHPKIIRGQVIDETGAALPGAVVLQLGAKTSAITDADGKFTIAVENFDKQLQASFMGYEPTTVSIRDTSKQLLLALAPNTKTLEEVVVMGYGTQKRAQTVGAAAAVKRLEQKSKDTLEEIYPYGIVEEKPRFMSSDTLDIFNTWLLKNLIFPSDSIKKDAIYGGRIVFQFVIGVDGKVSDVKILRSLSTTIDAEIERIVKSSPVWTPGKQDGKQVPVRCTIPLNIDLR